MDTRLSFYTRVILNIACALLIGVNKTLSYLITNIKTKMSSLISYYFPHFLCLERFSIFSEMTFVVTCPWGSSFDATSLHLSWHLPLPICTCLTIVHIAVISSCLLFDCHSDLFENSVLSYLFCTLDKHNAWHEGVDQIYVEWRKGNFWGGG